jgi:hypothetical protein
MNKTILSLFDYTGNWSKPYLDAGYNVIQVDKLLNGTDVRLIKYLSTRKIHGILSATPCTYFSQANKKPSELELIEGLSCADATLRMVYLFKPEFFCIENPAKSRLWQYYGKPKQIVQWNWYGMPFKKPTGLYGNFNLVSKNCPDAITTTINLVDANKSIRSITPLSFAYEFFKKNP